MNESELLSSVPDGLYVGGRWRAASDGATLDVLDPATGAVIRTVASASPEDGVAALDAACDAFPAWARTPARGRAEVAYGGEFVRWFAEVAAHVQGRYGATPEGTGRMTVTHHPVGPCYLITPWNFPLAMATRKIAPALAAGCTVVIKPAAPTPLTTSFLVRILEEAGLPPGVVNVVTTSRPGEVTEPIITDPRLRKLSFTGSTAVGQRLLKQAADNVLRASMELGGNAPFLMFEDADLDRAVDGAMLAKFRNVGQACTAANRFLVHRDVAEEFAERVTVRVEALKTGRGTEEGVVIGPLIDDKAVAKADALVQDAVARGATLRTGGRPPDGPGSFYPATVLSDVRPGSDLLREEIFGPVRPRLLCLHRVRRPRPAHGGAARDRDDGSQRRRDLERRGPLRRLEAVRARPRGRGRGHPRVPPDQVHPHPRTLRLRSNP
ncbi:aldehyde dehydrogenase family protein [Nocardioides cheoyonin]|uniref:aldehyde dehydrogenase family protein n=1 Tax=Nocardioides cheoyonin TaxID=3156615 RepID=UPI0032B4D7D3